MKKHLTIVIKLGTSSIVDEHTHEPLLSILSVIVETAVKLQHDGHKVILVSSGAIGVGLRRMDIEKRPKDLPKVQALAAIGQCRLMSLWDQLFSHMRQPVAQILLTRNDIADRTQYLNSQNTFFQLLDMGVIPIVNENDTLAVTEIKFGDNDTLSAITAGMVHADYLFLMTDVDCLYDKNPRTNPDAKPIEVVEDIDELEADVSSRGSSLGTGGMFTKIVAARRATSVGVTTIITRSSRPGNIRSIVKYAEEQKALRDSSHGTPTQTITANPMDGLVSLPAALNQALSPRSRPRSTESTSRQSSAAPPLHTRFLPASRPIRDRHFWLLHIFAPSGNIYVDEKAYIALSNNANLFPAGIVDVAGNFAQQEAVRIFLAEQLPNGENLLTNPSNYETAGLHPREVGRAVVNYSSVEIKRIKGLQATEISTVLGYADSEYVAFRENIAFFKTERSSPATPSMGSRNDVEADRVANVDRDLEGGVKI